MKKIISALCIAVAISGASFAQSTTTKKVTQPTVGAAKTPIFKWEKTTHDFGTIPQGTPVTAEFKFTNTGKDALIITSAQGSCGCTVPDYSKEPIAPNKPGVVRATFNAANPGAFTKTVTITSNAGTTPIVLTIKGEVKPAPDPVAAPK